MKKRSFYATTLLYVASVGGYTIIPQQSASNKHSALCRVNDAARQRPLVPLLSARTSPQDVEDKESDSKVAKRGWHRRVLKKVFRRGRNDARLRMKVATMDETQSTESFLRHSFELHSPSTLFPERLNDNQADLWSPAALQQVTISPMPTETKDEKTHESGSRLGRRFQNVITDLLDRWSKGSHINMEVQCDPSTNLLDVARGYFCGDASVDFDRIVFGPIRMSGGRIEAHKMGLNLYTFAPLFKGGPRFPHAFDFVAKNITFTQEDLFESNCIRNGLRRLLTRILQSRGLRPSTISIDSISILPSGKLSIQGHATNLFGTSLPFEVRSNLGTASRGHVLTFPGLELSLGPSLGIFVPVLPEVTLDLGHKAQLHSINMEGMEMHVSARVSITPKHTIKLQNYVQSSQSYSAPFSYDVGRWLTRIGRFSN